MCFAIFDKLYTCLHHFGKGCVGKPMNNTTTAPILHGILHFSFAWFRLKEILDPLDQVLGIPMEAHLVVFKWNVAIKLHWQLACDFFSCAPACWLVCCFSIKFLWVLWPHTAATGRNPSTSTWENFSRCSRQESCLHCTPLLQGVRRKSAFGWWKSCKWSWRLSFQIVWEVFFLPKVWNSKINGSSWEMRYCNDPKNLY